ncbi:MAG: CRTAC1 family protein [Candidatus Binatia bacterium]
MVSIGANSLNGNERNILFRNNGDGTFTDVAWVNAADRVEDGRAVCVLDYDRDGQLDIVLRNFRQPAQVLRNHGGASHWLQVKLVGVRSNRDAVGARLRLTTAQWTQTRWVTTGSAYLSNSSLVQHFGLGTEMRAEQLEIRWPSGATTRLADMAADRRYVVVEGMEVAIARER